MAFYSYNLLRSYACMLSFVLSNRGGGKTYGAKKIGIDEWLKTGRQFMYVRRRMTEFETKALFFDDIVAENLYPDYEFMTKGYTGLIRLKVDEEEGEKPNKWETLCHFVPLSVSTKFKSTPYPLVNNIFIDEIIIDTSVDRYLPNEPRILMELLSTVIRKRKDVKVFGLANNVSLVNPHFTFWNITVNPNKRFSLSKDKKIIVEMFADEDFIKDMESTPFGDLIKETDYGKYAIYNECLTDNNSFVMKRPSGLAKFYCSFVIEGKEIGVWSIESEDILFIDSKIDPKSKERYTLTTEDHTVNYANIASAKGNWKLEVIKRFYNQNLIFAVNQEHYQLFLKTRRYL